MILILKNLLFTLLVPGTVGVYLPLILSSSRSAASGFLFGLAILLLAIGGSIYGWCVFDFASFGRGTPLPLDAPKKLVRRGLYRYSRNPMYVGVLTVIFGWAALYKNPWLLLYGVAVALCFYSFVVFFEEPILSERFGSDYEQYRAEVARWLFRNAARSDAPRYPDICGVFTGEIELFASVKHEYSPRNYRLW